MDLGIGIGELPKKWVCKGMNLVPGTKLLDYNARADFIKIKVIDLKGASGRKQIDL